MHSSNHIVHALERLKDVRLTLERLYEGRRFLWLADQIIHNYELKLNLQIPENKAEELKNYKDRSRHLKTDFESLYLFGNILLDQWSLSVAYATGQDRPNKFSFFYLVNLLENPNYAGILQHLWENQYQMLLWLNSQIRFYRNKFIVHSRRPWQRGETHTLLGSDYKLFIPSPPGWLDDESINDKIKDLIPIAKKILEKKSEQYWAKVKPRYLLEELLDRIGQIKNKNERDKIRELVAKYGTLTPTFQIVGNNILSFINDATLIVQDIAIQNNKIINIGAPKKLK
ncbi:MAG: hypothetical protein U5R06_23495 [candidate division KSB1 bacterium]|nr:hypothetical protein [candidate division KSB1 bacterium]